MSDSRVLVAFQKLPDRRTQPLIERQGARVADVKDAMAKVARKLHDEASKINAGGRGYTWDYESIVYDVAAIGNDEGKYTSPTVVATMKMSR